MTPGLAGPQNTDLNMSPVQAQPSSASPSTHTVEVGCDKLPFHANWKIVAKGAGMPWVQTE
eukprot:CAMPEP_0203892842 /NCGR_PEP_ID=MMETSP0359-20131031/35985_1 /ASSEMBLY_ACC=CAM_ASM_000338 /TAXON_ID=268821 /ORGANISM="Scrippsiella Hangoei, Strain SHTV-5" /LENGTH=60 /DNA_ID=CAMNT_0050814877 /DNA_START=18 /DNA_END=197 /DNA_ORIENTATION=-